MQKTKEKYNPVPNTVMWIGASDSPNMIFIKEVESVDKEFRRIIYYHLPLRIGINKIKPNVIQYHVGIDLITRGTQNRIERYKSYHETYKDDKFLDWIKTLENKLNGKFNQKERIEDYEKMRIVVQPKASYVTQEQELDFWRYCEIFGSVTGNNNLHGESFNIIMPRKEMDKVLNNNNFRILYIMPEFRSD